MQQFCDSCLQGSPGGHAYYRIHEPPFFEKEQRGKLIQAVSPGCLFIGVNIQPSKFDLPIKLDRQLLQNGCDDMAGAAPVRVKLHQNGLRAFEHLFAKILLRQYRIHGRRLSGYHSYQALGLNFR